MDLRSHAHFTCETERSSLGGVIRSVIEVVSAVQSHCGSCRVFAAIQTVFSIGADFGWILLCSSCVACRPPARTVFVVAMLAGLWVLSSSWRPGLFLPHSVGAVPHGGTAAMACGQGCAHAPRGLVSKLMGSFFLGPSGTLQQCETVGFRRSVCLGFALCKLLAFSFSHPFVGP